MRYVKEKIKNNLNIILILVNYSTLKKYF